MMAQTMLWLTVQLSNIAKMVPIPIGQQLQDIFELCSCAIILSPLHLHKERLGYLCVYRIS